jgi:hypothetical protein
MGHLHGLPIADVYELTVYMEREYHYGKETSNRKMYGIVDKTTNRMMEVYPVGQLPEHWQQHFGVDPQVNQVVVPQNIIEQIQCSNSSL